MLPAADAAEGHVYTVTGQDWDSIVSEQAERGDERIVVNMGPQHPSTHGVLRLILELEGESVTEARCGIGYLHTGIEKNMEFRNWTQGVTFCTRMDYLSPLYQETTYCLGVERLLDIEAEIPEKANVIRVLMMELNRISSHLVCIATGGMEIGALTVMTIGFREREKVLDAFELITGLRMNHAYIRPGGVAQDLPDNALDFVKRSGCLDAEASTGVCSLLQREPDLQSPALWGRISRSCRLSRLGHHRPTPAGHRLRLGSAQEAALLRLRDLRLRSADLGHHGRLRAVPDPANEMWESLKIIEQCVERLEKMRGAPIMIADKKIAWPAQLSIGSDGMGNSNEYLKHIMGQSMEALIHHFKLVTEGFRVPPGQAYVPIESPRGELGAHVVSDGGTRPFRAHFRDPSFTNLQAMPAMCEGAMVSDVVVAVACRIRSWAGSIGDAAHSWRGSWTRAARIACPGAVRSVCRLGARQPGPLHAGVRRAASRPAKWPIRLAWVGRSLAAGA